MKDHQFFGNGTFLLIEKLKNKSQGFKDINNNQSNKKFFRFQVFQRFNERGLSRKG